MRALRAKDPASLQERPGLLTGRVAASRALFLLAAGLSFAISVVLWFSGQREQGLFVGLWVPSILSLGTLLMNARGDER